MQKQDIPGNSNINLKVDRISSIRDLLSVMFRRKWEGIVFCVVVMVLVIISTYRTVVMYESTAKILIKVGRENASLDPSVMGSAIGINQSRGSGLLSEVAIIKSRYIAERVVSNLDLGNLFVEETDKASGPTDTKEHDSGGTSIQQPEQANIGFVKKKKSYGNNEHTGDAVEMVMEHLSVKADEDSNTIFLAFLSRSPLRAQTILNNVIDIYMDRHIEIHQSQASPRFFMAQSEKLLKTLKQKELALEQFCGKRGIVSMESQKQTILVQIEKLENSINAARSQVFSSQEKIVLLEKTLGERSSTVEISRVTERAPSFSDIKQVLTDLQMKEYNLRSRYPDDSRILRDLRGEIELVKLKLAKEQESMYRVTTGIDNNYLILELDLEREKANLQSNLAIKQSTEIELKKKKDELAVLVGSGTAYLSLQRDVDIADGEYRKYRETLHQSNVFAALDIDKVSNVSMIQAPTYPGNTSKGHKKRNFLLGFVLAVGGGIGIIFFREFIDQTLKTDEDVNKYLGVPVLTTVPLIKAE